MQTPIPLYQILSFASLAGVLNKLTLHGWGRGRANRLLGHTLINCFNNFHGWLVFLAPQCATPTSNRDVYTLGFHAHKGRCRQLLPWHFLLPQVKRRFSDPYDRERGVQPFYLRSLHSFYSQYSTQWNSETARLLEYGGGPVIYSLISATKTVSEITFVDYLQGSLDSLEEWIRGTPGARDWKPYIKMWVRTNSWKL